MNTQEIEEYINSFNYETTTLRSLPKGEKLKRFIRRSNGRTSGREVDWSYTEIDSRLFTDNSLNFELGDITKDEFLKRNVDKFNLIIEAVNQKVGLEPGLKLTLVEVYAVIYSEIGLVTKSINGVLRKVIAPKRDHGVKEFGLLPLSGGHPAFAGNLIMGSIAPNPYKLYKPEINVQEFIIYLAGIKKHPDYPYSYHYNFDGIKGEVIRQSFLTSSIVHGYFGNTYRPKSGRPKATDILKIISSDGDLASFMKQTSFIAKGAIPGRMKNIRLGIELARSLS